MTILSPMTEAEFARYLELAIPDFARDKVQSGQWAHAQALELSRAGYAELLPQGLATPEHFLFTLRDRVTSIAVGMLWYAIQERGGERVAYVYDIWINTEHQRRGHASRAFAALEVEVKKRGLSGIGLHVFGHNAPARVLYQKLGYVPTNISLFKPVLP